MKVKSERHKLRQLRAVAHHEAGHAVMADCLGLRFKWVSIEPKPGSRGRLRLVIPRWLARHEPTDATFRAWVEADIMGQMAGFIAEKRLTGRGDHVGATDDYIGTLELARIVCFTRKEEDHYLDGLFERAAYLMSRAAVRRAVQLVASALLERKRLSEKEVHVLVDRAHREVRRARRRAARARRARSAAGCRRTPPASYAHPARRQ